MGQLITDPDALAVLAKVKAVRTRNCQVRTDATRIVQRVSSAAGFPESLHTRVR